MICSFFFAGEYLSHLIYRYQHNLVGSLHALVNLSEIWSNLRLLYSFHCICSCLPIAFKQIVLTSGAVLQCSISFYLEVIFQYMSSLIEVHPLLMIGWALFAKMSNLVKNSTVEAEIFPMFYFEVVFQRRLSSYYACNLFCPFSKFYLLNFFKKCRSGQCLARYFRFYILRLSSNECPLLVVMLAHNLGWPPFSKFYLLTF